MSAPIAANDNHNDFYVYAWLRQNGQPFYVGKGRGNRDKADKANNQIFQRIVAKMKRSGAEPGIVRIHENLTEAAAFELERAEIATHGRINNRTGILANLTDGGEGNSGWVPSEETRAKIGAVHAGKTLSAEHRALLLDVVSNPSQDTRAKMSAAHLGRKHTDATKAKMRAINSNRSPETRAKLSAALKGIPKSAEHKAKISDMASNRSEEHRAKLSAANRMRPPISGYKGVSFDRKLGKWKVAIRIGDKRPFLGYFTASEDAAKRYDEAAIEAWGLGHCYLNFPSADKQTG